MAPTAPTVASLMRQKQIVPSAMMKKVTNRVNQLQEELALESVTNIEFEESSRRSFEFLAAQVNTLKAAFNNLADTFLQELEHVRGEFGTEIHRLEEKSANECTRLEEKSSNECSRLAEKIANECMRLEEKSTNECMRLEENLIKNEGDIQRLGKRVDHLSSEVDTVLTAVPKIEDSVLKSNHHFQDRLEQTANSLQKTTLMIQNLEERIGRTEDNLREDFEQQYLQLQRNFTRQLDAINRVLKSDVVRAEGNVIWPSGHISQSPKSVGGYGGSYSSPNLRESPKPGAWSTKSDRSPFLNNSPTSVGGRERLAHSGIEDRSRLDFDSPFKGAR